MKNFKYLFLSLCLGLFSVACEDDDPLTAGEGDPLLKNVVSVEATVSTDQPTIGEGNVLTFSVTLGQTFASDADVTVRVELDNGLTATGQATVTAGSSSGTGTLTMPADDNLIAGETIDGALNAAILTAEAILLDELVPDTTFVLNSNTFDLNIYPDTLPVGGGVNILADWNGAPAVDIDMQVIDRAFTAIFESAASGSRFETDLFQTVGRDDGIYDIYLIPFVALPAEGTPYAILMTLPDGSLVDVVGTLPGDSVVGARVAVATFEKSTDVATGVVSYINVGAL